MFGEAKLFVYWEKILICREGGFSEEVQVFISNFNDLLYPFA